MRILLLVIAVAGLGAVQTSDPRETRIPAGHYCKRRDVPISKNETRAHPCDCTYSCRIDENGNVVEHESEVCQAWCHKDGRRCTCHVEAPCPSDGHNALMDMNGRVVLVARQPHR